MHMTAGGSIMDRETLEFRHRDLLFGRLRSLNPRLSEYSFANLYLFRKNHDYEVLTRDGEVYVRGRSYDGRIYLMPTSDVNALDLLRMRELLADVDFLFPVPEDRLSLFDPTTFDVTFKDGDRDYVYTVEKMSTYAGRKLHKKRNLLSQFLRDHEAAALPLTNDRLADAREVLEEWQATSDMKASDTDYGPCKEALDQYETLMLCGGIYYADNEPAGFVLGEELNNETYVLHFAKAKTKFKGIYQYLFNNFAKVLPPKYRYLNLEQDLDKENLRVFKSSYVPDALLRKARVSLR
jgi:hypothetical protein